MAKAKKPAKRAGNHRPKNRRPPKPELLDWSTFDPLMAPGQWCRQSGGDTAHIDEDGAIPVADVED